MRYKIAALAFAAGLAAGSFSAAQAGFIAFAPVGAHGSSSQTETSHSSTTFHSGDGEQESESTTSSETETSDSKTSESETSEPSSQESSDASGGGSHQRKHNHGFCVSQVAHSTPPGPGHGAAVSKVAQSNAGKNGASC